MNPRCAPARIGQIHFSYQGANLVICWRTTIACSTLPCPVEPESPTIPGDNCLRLYNFQRRTPVLPEARQRHPKRSIRWFKAEPATLCQTLQYKKLMAQGENFSV